MARSWWLLPVGLSCLFLLLPTAATAEVDPEPPGPFKNSLGMRFAHIRSGKFKMGSPKDENGRNGDEALHEVEISRSFRLGVHEVTQKQYKEVMGTNPSTYQTDEDLPVESVTWNEAVEFCKKLSARKAEKEAGRVYRLPTEAEWEYSCRAGSDTAYLFGKDITKEQANILSSSINKTATVGSYKPNKWGLFDMHGNVWEWCQDWYGSDYYANSPKKDPPGPAKGEARSLRGGCHASPNNLCRAANRNYDKVDSFTRNTKSLIGFRVVCTSAAR